VLEGLRKLIEQEKLVRPIVVGHFTLGTQLALRMALNFPDKIGGVIVMGGPGKFVPVQSGKVINVPPDKRVMLTDQYMKPFFRTVTKTYWDGNNYMLGLYSLNPEVGQQLWDQVAAVPMPVMIRYLCEFQAEDLTGQVAAIKCPVLVLRPGFKEVWLNDTQNGTLNYIKPQFIDSWDEFKSKNSSFEIKDVAESGVFTWKDQPKITYQLIREFVDGSIR
jgi:pimeloyl-ACP methyl ester carboxylesterase